MEKKIWPVPRDAEGRERPLPFRVLINTDEERWRYRTFWTKEPETIAWIDSFEPESYFLDIGANIGLYSLYAASLGHVVYAVEPHPYNFMALIDNMRENGFDWSKFHPERFAVSDISRSCRFSFKNLRAGSSDGKIDDDGEYEIIKTFCVSINRFAMYHALQIDHIKIDVDGDEARVVMGMADILSRQELISCLIEIAPQHKEFIFSEMDKYGYTVLDSGLNYMSPHSRERRKEEGIDVENWIFYRS